MEEQVKTSLGTKHVEKKLQNFTIPKIKRSVDKFCLVRCSPNRREYGDILDTLNKGRLNLSSDLKSSWTFAAIKLVSNNHLTEKFTEKRNEMKELGRHNRELEERFCFLVVPNNTAIDVAQHGLSAGNTTTKELGNPELGVYLFRHIDVALNFAHRKKMSSCVVLIFKVLFGKVKPVQPGSALKSVLDPTPHFDCHISKKAPLWTQPLDEQVTNSLIYVYEYDSSFKPATTPRQCLPIAAVDATFIVNKSVTTSVPVRLPSKPSSSGNTTLANCTVVKRIGKGKDAMVIFKSVRPPLVQTCGIEAAECSDKEAPFIPVLETEQSCGFLERSPLFQNNITLPDLSISLQQHNVPLESPYTSCMVITSKCMKDPRLLRQRDQEAVQPVGPENQYSVLFENEMSCYNEQNPSRENVWNAEDGIGKTSAYLSFEERRVRDCFVMTEEPFEKGLNKYSSFFTYFEKERDSGVESLPNRFIEERAERPINDQFSDQLGTGKSLETEFAVSMSISTSNCVNKTGGKGGKSKDDRCMSQNPNPKNKDTLYMSFSGKETEEEIEWLPNTSCGDKTELPNDKSYKICASQSEAARSRVSDFTSLDYSKETNENQGKTSEDNRCLNSRNRDTARVLYSPLYGKESLSGVESLPNTSCEEKPELSEKPCRNDYLYRISQVGSEKSQQSHSLNLMTLDQAEKNSENGRKSENQKVKNKETAFLLFEEKLREKKELPEKPYRNDILYRTCTSQVGSEKSQQAQSSNLMSLDHAEETSEKGRKSENQKVKNKETAFLLFDEKLREKPELPEKPCRNVNLYKTCTSQVGSEKSQQAQSSNLLSLDNAKETSDNGKKSQNQKVKNKETVFLLYEEKLREKPELPEKPCRNVNLYKTYTSQVGSEKSQQAQSSNLMSLDNAEETSDNGKKSENQKVKNKETAFLLFKEKVKEIKFLTNTSCEEKPKLPEKPCRNDNLYRISQVGSEKSQQSHSLNLMSLDHAEETSENGRKSENQKVKNKETAFLLYEEKLREKPELSEKPCRNVNLYRTCTSQVGSEKSQQAQSSNLMSLNKAEETSENRKKSQNQKVKNKETAILLFKEKVKEIKSLPSTSGEETPELSKTLCRHNTLYNIQSVQEKSQQTQVSESVSPNTSNYNKETAENGKQSEIDQRISKKTQSRNNYSARASFLSSERKEKGKEIESSPNKSSLKTQVVDPPSLKSSNNTKETSKNRGKSGGHCSVSQDPVLKEKSAAKTTSSIDFLKEQFLHSKKKILINSSSTKLLKKSKEYLTGVKQRLYSLDKDRVYKDAPQHSSEKVTQNKKCRSEPVKDHHKVPAEVNIALNEKKPTSTGGTPSPQKLVSTAAPHEKIKYQKAKEKWTLKTSPEKKNKLYVSKHFIEKTEEYKKVTTTKDSRDDIYTLESLSEGLDTKTTQNKDRLVSNLSNKINVNTNRGEKTLHPSQFNPIAISPKKASVPSADFDELVQDICIETALHAPYFKKGRNQALAFPKNTYEDVSDEDLCFLTELEKRIDWNGIFGMELEKVNATLGTLQSRPLRREKEPSGLRIFPDMEITIKNNHFVGAGAYTDNIVGESQPSMEAKEAISKTFQDFNDVPQDPQIIDSVPGIQIVGHKVTDSTPGIQIVGHQVTDSTPGIEIVGHQITDSTPGIQIVGHQITDSTPGIQIVGQVTDSIPGIQIVGHQVTVSTPGIEIVGHQITDSTPGNPIVGHQITDSTPGIEIVGHQITDSTPGIPIVGQVTDSTPGIPIVGQVTDSTPGNPIVGHQITDSTPGNLIVDDQITDSTPGIPIVGQVIESIPAIQIAAESPILQDGKNFLKDNLDPLSIKADNSDQSSETVVTRSPLPLKKVLHKLDLPTVKKKLNKKRIPSVLVKRSTQRICKFSQSEENIKVVLGMLSDEIPLCKNKRISKKLDRAVLHLRKAHKRVQKSLQLVAKAGERRNLSKSSRVQENHSVNGKEGNAKQVESTSSQTLQTEDSSPNTKASEVQKSPTADKKCLTESTQVMVNGASLQDSQQAKVNGGSATKMSLLPPCKVTTCIQETPDDHSSFSSVIVSDKENTVPKVPSPKSPSDVKEKQAADHEPICVLRKKRHGSRRMFSQVKKLNSSLTLSRSKCSSTKSHTVHEKSRPKGKRIKERESITSIAAKTSSLLLRKLSDILQKASETDSLSALQNCKVKCQEMIPAFIKAFEKKQRCVFKDVIVDRRLFVKENLKTRFRCTLKPEAVEAFLELQMIMETNQFVENRMSYIEGRPTFRSLLWYDGSLYTELLTGESGFQQQSNLYSAFQEKLKLNSLATLENHYTQLSEFLQTLNEKDSCYYVYLKYKRELQECEDVLRHDYDHAEFSLSVPFSCGVHLGDTIDDLTALQKSTVEIIRTFLNLPKCNPGKKEHALSLLEVISAKIDYIKTSVSTRRQLSLFGIEHLLFDAAKMMAFNERKKHGGQGRTVTKELLSQINDIALSKLYEVYCVKSVNTKKSSSREVSDPQESSVFFGNQDVFLFGKIIDQARCAEPGLLKKMIQDCNQHLELQSKCFQILQECIVDEVIIRETNVLDMAKRQNKYTVLLKPEAVEAYIDLAMTYETLHFLTCLTASRKTQPRTRGLLWYDTSLFSDLVHNQRRLESFLQEKVTPSAMDIIDSTISEIKSELEIISNCSDSVNYTYAFQIMTRELSELSELKNFMRSEPSLATYFNFSPFVASLHYGNSLTELDHNYLQLSDYLGVLMSTPKKDLGKLAHTMKILKTIEFTKDLVFKPGISTFDFIACSVLSNRTKRDQALKRQTREGEQIPKSQSPKKRICANMSAEDSTAFSPKKQKVLRSPGKAFIEEKEENQVKSDLRDKKESKFCFLTSAKDSKEAGRIHAKGGKASPSDRDKMKKEDPAAGKCHKASAPIDTCELTAIPGDRPLGDRKRIDTRCPESISCTGTECENGGKVSDIERKKAGEGFSEEKESSLDDNMSIFSACSMDMNTSEEAENTKQLNPATVKQEGGKEDRNPPEEAPKGESTAWNGPSTSAAGGQYPQFPGSAHPWQYSLYCWYQNSNNSRGGTQGYPHVSYNTQPTNPYNQSPAFPVPNSYMTSQPYSGFSGQMYSVATPFGANVPYSYTDPSSSNPNPVPIPYSYSSTANTGWPWGSWQ